MTGTLLRGHNKHFYALYIESDMYYHTFSSHTVRPSLVASLPAGQ